MKSCRITTSLTLALHWWPRGTVVGALVMLRQTTAIGVTECWNVGLEWTRGGWIHASVTVSCCGTSKGSEGDTGFDPIAWTRKSNSGNGRKLVTGRAVPAKLGPVNLQRILTTMIHDSAWDPSTIQTIVYEKRGQDRGTLVKNWQPTPDTRQSMCSPTNSDQPSAIVVSIISDDCIRNSSSKIEGGYFSLAWWSGYQTIAEYVSTTQGYTYTQQSFLTFLYVQTDMDGLGSSWLDVKEHCSLIKKAVTKKCTQLARYLQRPDTQDYPPLHPSVFSFLLSGLIK